MASSESASFNAIFVSLSAQLKIFQEDLTRLDSAHRNELNFQQLNQSHGKIPDRTRREAPISLCQSLDPRKHDEDSRLRRPSGCLLPAQDRRPTVHIGALQDISKLPTQRCSGTRDRRPSFRIGAEPSEHGERRHSAGNGAMEDTRSSGSAILRRIQSGPQGTKDMLVGNTASFANKSCESWATNMGLMSTAASKFVGKKKSDLSVMTNRSIQNKVQLHHIVPDTRQKARHRDMYCIFSATRLGHNNRLGSMESSIMDYLVLDPSTPFCLFWSSMELALLCYDLIMIPISISGLEPPRNIVISVMVYLSLCFWTLDIPLSFFKGYVTQEGELSNIFRKCAKNYLKTRFTWDLLLMLIEWANFLISTLDSAEYASSGRMLRLMRFSRLAKMGKLQKIWRGVLNRVRSNLVLTFLSISRVVAGVILYSHFVACGWFAIRNEAVDEPFGIRYGESLSWSLSLLGFGMTSMRADSSLEHAYTNVATLAYVLIFSFMVGRIVILMDHLHAMLRARGEKEEQFRTYMCRHKVSTSLRSRIWVFLTQQQLLQHEQPEHESKVELIRSLTKTLVMELRAEVFIPVLTSHPFFGTYAVSQADSYAMQQLVEQRTLQETFLTTEQELFSEGDKATHMYWVTQGCIVYRNVNNARSRDSIVIATTTNANAQNYLNELRCYEWESAYADDKCTPVCAGQWISELALWTKWHHAGLAFAKLHTGLVALDAEVFNGIMRRYLPEAKRYSALFLAYVQEQQFWTDLCVPQHCIRSMAQEVFKPPTFFHVMLCRPSVSKNRDEWHPSGRRTWQQIWTSAWREGHGQNRSALLAMMSADLKHDVILMYQTLFSQNCGSPCPILTEEETLMHDRRVLFLKRLLLAFAVAGINYCSIPNGSRKLSWPFPLASALAHGSRVLVRLLDVRWKSFLSFLVHGDPDEWQDQSAPGPLYTRRGASHKVQLDPVSLELKELKQINLSTFTNNHLGMDIPLGGMGNPAPYHKRGNFLIGPYGTPYKKQSGKEVYLHHIQHGHLYLRWDDFGKRTELALDTPVAGHYSTSSLRANRSRSGATRSRTRSRSFTGTSSGMDALRSSTGRKGSMQGVWDSADVDWVPVNCRSTTELQDTLKMLQSEELPDANYKHEDLVELHALIGSGCELQFEASQDGEVRCRGVLIHLWIEHESKVLIHRAATAASNRCEETRLVTVICRNGEQWTEAVPRYLRQVLLLEPPAIERLLDGCFKAKAESFMFKSENAGTVGHYHQVCKALDMDLVYDNLHLKCQLTEADRALFAPILEPNLETVEQHVELRGFGDNTVSGVGSITREWEWQQVDRTHFLRVNIESAHNLATAAGVAMCKCFCVCEIAGKPDSRVTTSAVESAHWRFTEEMHDFSNGDDSLTFTVYACDAAASAVELCSATLGPEQLGQAGFSGKLELLEDHYDTGEPCYLKVSATPLSSCAALEDLLDWPAFDQRIPVNVTREEREVNSLLVGIESSCPLKEDLFGMKHGPDAQPKLTSAFGKPKWREYAEQDVDVEVPTDLGGMQVVIDEFQFKKLQELCEILQLCKPSDGICGLVQAQEMDLFRSLLESNDEGFEDIIRDHVTSNSSHLEAEAPTLFWDLCQDRDAWQSLRMQSEDSPFERSHAASGASDTVSTTMGRFRPAMVYDGLSAMNAMSTSVDGASAPAGSSSVAAGRRSVSQAMNAMSTSVDGASAPAGSSSVAAGRRSGASTENKVNTKVTFAGTLTL